MWFGTQVPLCITTIQPTALPDLDDEEPEFDNKVRFWQSQPFQERSSKARSNTHSRLMARTPSRLYSSKD